MAVVEPKDLLKNREVIQEIERHKWIESEKAGRDIGFEAAAEDWLKRFSAAWMAYHMPSQRKSDENSSVASPKSSFEESPKLKRRKAKSYLKA